MPELACRIRPPEPLARPRPSSRDDDAFAAPAAGEFTAMGNFVCALLVSLGLEPGHLVVDVGCGSGWLAPQLACFPRLRYLGSDVSPDLLAHTRALAHRDDWRFALAAGDAIPCAAGAADFVCLSSLFAHLLPGDAVRHLAEARRVLTPGGCIVFSFFDFALDRDAIALRAARAGLCLERIVAADTPLVPLDEIFPWAARRHLGACRCLGQSVAVLSAQSTAACERVESA